MIATARTVDDMQNMLEPQYETHSPKKNTHILSFKINKQRLEDLLFTFKKNTKTYMESEHIIELLQQLPYTVKPKYIKQLLCELNGEYGGDRTIFFGKEVIKIDQERSNGELVFSGGREEWDARYEEENTNPELYQAIMHYTTR